MAKNLVRYQEAGRLTRSSYTYDAEGNVLTANGNTYTYDAFNRRIASSNGTANVGYGTAAEFVYDPFGRRTSTWITSINFGNEGRIYADNRQIAFRAFNGQTFFEHQDWLGTERMRTNYQGQVAAKSTSLAFGEGYLQNTLLSNGDQDNLHFGGLDHDTETNTDHAQFRQYSPTQGRWMSPDPYDGSYDAFNPQSLNRYTYVLNNPLSLHDSKGLYCEYGDDAGEGLLEPVDYNSSPEECGKTGGSWYNDGWGSGSGGSTYNSGTGVWSDPTFGGTISSSGDGTTGGAPGAPSSSLGHIAYCSAAVFAIGQAQLTGRVAGYGIGGNAGIGFIFGLFGSVGAQHVADPTGNIGIALSESHTLFGVGASALLGGQYTVSTAKRLSDLGGGSGTVSAGGSNWNVDASISPDGTTTVTGTVGVGFESQVKVGGKVGGSLSGGGTGIVGQTNCSDIFPRGR